MQDVIARLRTKPGLVIADKEQSWELQLLKPDDLALEVSVPRKVLEWFVTVRRASTNQEIWSDWMDYYKVRGEAEAGLRTEMKRDVERFIERSLASTFRVIESRTLLGRHRRLEWRTDAGWKKVSLCEDAV